MRAHHQLHPPSTRGPPYSFVSTSNAADLDPIVIRRIPGIPANWTVRLTLETPTNVASGIDASEVVRVFPNNTANTAGLLGPGTATVTFVEDDPAHNIDLAGLRGGDVTLYVEGLEFAGEVRLVLEVADGTGTLQHDDRIQLKVSPFILLPNTALASRVLVADNDPSFHAAIAGLAGAGNVITTTVGDQWPQDAWEFGFCSTPFQTSNIAFETLRAHLVPPDFQSRPLQDLWGRPNLLGPTPSDPNRSGLIYRQADVNDGLAYGGNLEVTPPLVDAPLGRIVVGTMPAVQTDFLSRQGVQTPLIQLDTSWLDVVHVDEFMSFVPDPMTGGWDVVWASPNQAAVLLSEAAPFEPLFYCDVNDVVITGQATGGTSDTLLDSTADFLAQPFFRYVRIYEGTGKGQIAEIDPAGITPTSIGVKDVWLFDKMVDYWHAVDGGVGIRPANSWFTTPDDTSKYILAPCSQQWSAVDPEFGVVRELPALVTAREITADPDYFTFNLIPGQAAIEMAASTDTIPFWPITDSVTFLEIPALYMGDNRLSGDGWAVALVPGMVNLQVWHTTLQSSLWIPKPFGPRTGAGVFRFDLFESAADQVLSVGRNTVYINDWDTYHRYSGEVHCGTNVIRVVPDGHGQWWQAQP